MNVDRSTSQVLPQVLREILRPLSAELSSADISTLRLVDGALSNLLRSAVRTRINKCAAVNSLPPEVLSAIFELIRAGCSNCEDVHGHHPAILRPDKRSLIAMTHVCRRWRTVALECAQLWTHVSTMCAMAPLFFERSRGMPLTVFVSLIQGRPPPVPKRVFLLQHPRIRALHIDLACGMQIHHWRKHLRILAGSLESLTVVNHGRQMRVRASPPLVVPFFGAERPTALKFLSISSMTVLIPTDHFPALEHARLSMPDSFSPSMPEPRILLGNAPRLQTFHLHLHWTSAFRSQSYEGIIFNPIDLLRMQHLCITLPRILLFYPAGNDHYGAVRMMLTNLNLPPSAIISIQETAWTDTRWRMPDLYIVPAVSGSTAESVLTIGGRRTTFTVGGFPTTSFEYAADITPSQLCSPIYGIREAPTKAALTTVRALRIHSTPLWLRASPRSFCLHNLATYTPRLTALVVRDYTGEMAPHLARMLVPRGTGPVPCPALVSVTYITLAGAYPVHMGRFVLAPDALAIAPAAPKAATATLNTLLAATAARARALGQRPLPRLVFCCPSAPREYVLEDVHGVARVEVLRADAWAAPDSDGVFERSAEARFRCCCPVPVGTTHGSGLTRAAHRQARRVESIACMPEEEYDVAWAAERARVEDAPSRPPAEAAAEPETQAGIGTGGRAGTRALFRGLGLEPGAGERTTAEPGVDGWMVGGFEHPSRTVANPHLQVGVDQGPATGLGRVTVLMCIDLACFLLSLWFVQLLVGR